MPPPKKKKRTAVKKKQVVQARPQKEVRAEQVAKEKKKRDKPLPFSAKKVKKLPSIATAKDLPSPEEASREYLRYAAMIHYTTDLNGFTVAQLHKHPMFSGVPIATLETWSTKDKWRERRKEVLAKWRAQIEKATGDRLVQARLAALERVSKIRGKLLDKLDDPTVFDSVSGDKAVNALVKLMQIEWEMSEVVLKTIQPSVANDPKAPANDSGIPVQAKLSTPEARLAAKAILQRRRSKLREDINDAPE